ncbi:hypothetical protein B7494_g7286 [Chlorociboria aeruginascens]|nr:hypothetical protein B7494_g7286 [Chlorociboria aeruginascens]
MASFGAQDEHSDVEDHSSNSNRQSSSPKGNHAPDPTPLKLSTETQRFSYLSTSLQLGAPSRVYSSPYGASKPPPLVGDSHSLDLARTEFQHSSAQRRSQSREVSADTEFLSVVESMYGTIVPDELDTDPSYREFHLNLAKFKDTVGSLNSSSLDEGQSLEFQPALSHSVLPERDLLHSHVRGRHQGSTSRPRGRPPGPRGPRKAAEPTGDIKWRLGKASEAFINEEYIEARDIVYEIIRINAETYEAWTLLASIFEELGDLNYAVMSLMYGAHMRPKHVGAWLICARFALEETGEHRKRYIPSAQFCYSSALRADPKNYEARCGKAALYLEEGRPSQAVSEYALLLKIRPRDLNLLRALAEACVDQNDVGPAIALYKESITHLKNSPHESDPSFNWSDAYVYVELYSYQDRYEAAISELKSVARWLLGRESEDYWDEVTCNDCEWDEDNTRRIEHTSFSPDTFPLSAYGLGLPLELRVRLGSYRLNLGHHEEAMCHWMWLDPSDDSGQSKSSRYPELFLEVGHQLHRAGLHQQALKFYLPLTKVTGYNSASLQVEMGRCYLQERLGKQAEECFQAAIQLDETNIEARMDLAKMYEDLNEEEQAFIFVSEIMSLRRAQNPRDLRWPRQSQDTEANKQNMVPARSRRSYYPRRLADPLDRAKEESARAQHLQRQYLTIMAERDRMRDGNAVSTRIWMEAAKDLTDDFRGFKTFYPWDKYIRFIGYTGPDPSEHETPLDTDLSAMADRLTKNLGADIADKTNVPAVKIPADYQGISLESWLDIFLEYALCLARNGKIQDSYEICEAAKDAVVFYCSRQNLFLIHVCWGVCALFANDEGTCVTVARFFMKDYQFTTDSYRLYATITRACQSPVSWYSAPPTQKYILRQIKAMDYSLTDKGYRDQYFSEKGSYSAQDENGHLIINDDMDIALLMLYGHILYTSSSYSYALNYFLRAYALDTSNPIINLTIGLAYIHHALQRQAENRQHLILQGLTFLFRYYDAHLIRGYYNPQKLS